MKFHHFAPLLLLAVIPSCTWVQLTTEGETVRLGVATEVANCERLGRTRAQTTSEIVFVERGGSRVQQELLTLARNEAGSMGGNVIVPETVIEEGHQTFGVYQCP